MMHTSIPLLAMCTAAPWPEQLQWQNGFIPVVSRVPQVQRALPVLRVQPGLRARRDLRVQRDRPEHRGLKVILVRQAPQDLREQLALPVRRGPRARRAPGEVDGQRVPRSPGQVPQRLFLAVVVSRMHW